MRLITKVVADTSQSIIKWTGVSKLVDTDQGQTLPKESVSVMGNKKVGVSVKLSTNHYFSSVTGSIMVSCCFVLFFAYKIILEKEKHLQEK